jgi:hypothetical protein
VQSHLKYRGAEASIRQTGEHEEITLDEHTGQYVRIFSVVIIFRVDV